LQHSRAALQSILAVVQTGIATLQTFPAVVQTHIAALQTLPASCRGILSANSTYLHLRKAGFYENPRHFNTKAVAVEVGGVTKNTGYIITNNRGGAYAQK